MSIALAWDNSSKTTPIELIDQAQIKMELDGRSHRAVLKSTDNPLYWELLWDDGDVWINLKRPLVDKITGGWLGMGVIKDCKRSAGGEQTYVAITWDNDKSTTPIAFIGHDRVKMEHYGESYTAVLKLARDQPHWELHWDDGDVWLKTALEPQMKRGSQSTSAPGRGRLQIGVLKGSKNCHMSTICEGLEEEEVETPTAEKAAEVTTCSRSRGDCGPQSCRSSIPSRCAQGKSIKRSLSWPMAQRV